MKARTIVVVGREYRRRAEGGRRACYVTPDLMSHGWEGEKNRGHKGEDNN